MANIFSNSPEDDDEDQTSGGRVAGALTGDGEGAPEEAPQAEQPQGAVDGAAQSYLNPVENGDEESQQPTAAQAAAADAPVSADTAAYMTPIAPPTLGKPATYADHSADTAAMTQQKQREAAQDIKPSIGRRILAGLAGGAVAFGGGNGEGTVQGVLNRPAQEAQREWAQQEAPLQAKLNADQAADAATTRSNTVAEQGNRLAETDYGNQIRGQQDAAHAADYQAQADARKNAITSFTPDDPANPYAGGTGTTADGRTIKGVPPPDKWLANWEKNPDNVASAEAQKGIKTVKALQAAGVKLTPEQIAIVASGGKVTPAVRTSINIRENPDGSPVTPRGAQGAGEAIAKSMQDKQSYVDSLNRQDSDTVVDGVPVKAGLYDKQGNPVSEQQFRDRIEKFRTDLNNDPVMRNSGTMVDENGNTVTGRFSRNPQKTAPAPAPPAGSPPAAPAYKAKSGATVTVNTRVVVNGRPGVVTGFDKNGKPQVDYGR